MVVVGGTDPHGQSRFWRKCARVGFKINKSGDMTIMVKAVKTCESLQLRALATETWKQAGELTNWKL